MELGRKLKSLCTTQEQEDAIYKRVRAGELTMRAAIKELEAPQVEALTPEQKQRYQSLKWSRRVRQLWKCMVKSVADNTDHPADEIPAYIFSYLLQQKECQSSDTLAIIKAVVAGDEEEGEDDEE